MDADRALAEVRIDTDEIVGDFVEFVEDEYEPVLDAKTKTDLSRVKDFVAANARLSTHQSIPFLLLLAELSIAEDVYASLERHPRLGFSNTGTIHAMRYMIRREIEEKRNCS